MKLNTKKSNIMIFNPTKKFKFTTRLTMNNFTLPVINKTKLLGTIITDDLKWNSNTEEIVKKANQRMLLLRKSSDFTTKTEDLKAIYLSYVRGTLEQSSVLWGSTLSEENKSDIERVQKNACRIILGKNYTSYEESLHLIGLETLEERRKHLALKFSENCIDNKKTRKLFPLRKKAHKLKTRKEEKFKILKSKKKRLQTSTIPFLRKLLNDNYFKNHKL